MRPQHPRARAALGMGAISTAALAAGTAFAAEPPAPAQQPAPQAAPATAKAPASLRVTSRRVNVRAGRIARVGGRLTPAAAGRTVTLERRARRGWKTIDKARTTGTGRFALRYRTRRVDTAAIRVRFAGDTGTAPAVRRAGRLNVYRPALASWYGPGLYGNRLGCGGRLSAGTLGVAHKSLPCGSRVVLRKGKRIVRTRVIDRGPYVGAREFDLTQATKRRLGFGSTGTVLVAH
jgi:rare lipoprotein A